MGRKSLPSLRNIRAGTGLETSIPHGRLPPVQCDGAGERAGPCEPGRGGRFLSHSASVCVAVYSAAVPRLTVLPSSRTWVLLMVRVAVFPELEPENCSGIPEGHLLSS